MTTNWEQSFDKLSSIRAAGINLPDKVFKDLRKACDKAKKKNQKVKKNLIGHINEEYNINEVPVSFNDFLLRVALNTDVIVQRTRKLAFASHNKPFYLDRLWVNYQKKYEFNPPHDHAGIYSFVIFMQIPYDLKKEETYFTKMFAENITPMTSKFAFQNINMDGEIATEALHVDKSFEGKMIIFPASQVHTVFPFYTSNKYRITVSGNIRLNVS